MAKQNKKSTLMVIITLVAGLVGWYMKNNDSGLLDNFISNTSTYGGGENNGERLDKQGKYFGGLNREQTAKLGKLGKERTMSLVKGQKFKVITKWQPVTNRQKTKRTTYCHGERCQET